MKADLYVKDDTELNASGSTFQLSGDYFGYGDSTEKDDRKFTPVVDAKNFQIEVTSNGKTKTENRGHYNSSAIIVNGEQSTLNLALIAVVGRGMKATRGTAGRIFAALAHANVNVRMIDQGSSELNIIIGVSNEDFEAAIKAIYAIFVEIRL